MGPTEANTSESPQPEGISGKSPLAEGISGKPPFLGLPNELFFEVFSHLKGFKDLNSLVRTSHLFHGKFNTHLYERAISADRIVLDEKIVGWVLSEYRLSSLKLLLDNGLSVNHTGLFNFNPCNKETMLGFLCRLDDQERSVPLARLLIQRGADTNAKDASSNTVLHRAIEHGNSEIAALLLAHGADRNAVNYWGDTPLCLASRRNEARMVNLLVAHGAAIDGRSEHGNTPLLVAIAGCASNVIPILFAHGANIGAYNNDGITALHQASISFHRRHLKLAKSLLTHGAAVNAIDNRGETPLHYASRNTRPGSLFMVKFLLKNGADVNALSQLGHSPLQHAVRMDHQRVAPLLVAHGADYTVLNRRAREFCWRIIHGEHDAL
jgi:ankyrin repeat protein